MDSFLRLRTNPPDRTGVSPVLLRVLRSRRGHARSGAAVLALAWTINSVERGAVFSIPQPTPSQKNSDSPPMNLLVNPLPETDLAEADRVFRIAFGTFLGLPNPKIGRASCRERV